MTGNSRTIGAALLGLALAAASVFYLLSPTVYAYFSEVTLSYARAPAWVMRSLPARQTMRIFARYNVDSPVAARLRTRLACDLTDDGARRRPGCTHEIRSGEIAHGPAGLKLAAGVYLATFRFAALESCAGAGIAHLTAVAAGRSAKTLGSFAGPVRAGDQIQLRFTLELADAAFSDLEFRAAGMGGCVVLTRIDCKELSAAGR